MRKLLKNKLTKKNKRLLEIRALQALLTLILGVAVALGVVLWQVNKDEARRLSLQIEAEKAVQNSVLPPDTKPIGGPFTLIDQDGKTVTDADFKGNYLLVYFGYTYCPDICPTGLESIAHALDQLGDDADKVQPLYITIDPVRDTPAKLKHYIESFHPEIIGLTGSPAQIAAVTKAYQVYYAKGEKVDEHDYLMDHSSLIYLMGPNGKYITSFPENAEPKALVAALREEWASNPPAKPLK
jgi:protein SCO1/2